MQKGLGVYHPIVSFSYFLVVIGSAMLYNHPIFAFISIVSATIYSYSLDKEKTKNILLFTTLMAIAITLANVAFVNRGVTVIFYFRTNPVTLESLYYGIMSGTLMASVIIWFSNYNEIVTSDKFLYIFSKVLPSIALMVNMTLRLIPKLIQQIKIIADTQKTIGLDYSEGSISHRIKSSMRILSILVTWALEDSVHTADSMKARGYGIKKRSNFSIYNFVKRDFVVFMAITIIGMFLLMGYINGYSEFLFYPTIQKLNDDNLSKALYLSYLGISLLPTILSIMEEHKWKYLK